MPRDRILRFLADPGSDGFERLALDAFAFQYERILPCRRLCRARGVERPSEVPSWREIPAVPALAFKSLELHAAPPVETFRSSGTSGGERSVHRHPYPELYRAAVDASFPGACLPHLERPPMLSLIPDREQAPDSSLAFMVEHVMERWGGPESKVAFGPRGVERQVARGWLAARQRAGRPALVLATAFALVQLLDFLEHLDLRFRLPPGSVVFETGGFKGRTRTVERGELLTRLEARLGVPVASVVREYGMTELTSQLYTGTLAGGDPDLFLPPHWVRLRVLDPETLGEAEEGSVGLIAVLDLANLGSAVHVLTQDLGMAEGGAVRLVGRAAGAELRGCSLVVEELEGGV